MTNVVSFPKPQAKQAAKVKPKPKSKTKQPPQYKMYWITDLTYAMQIAAYVYEDKDSVEKLSALVGKMLLEGKRAIYLPSELREQCLEYLPDHPEYFYTLSKNTQAIFC